MSNTMNQQSSGKKVKSYIFLNYNIIKYSYSTNNCVRSIVFYAAVTNYYYDYVRSPPLYSITRSY